VVLERFVSITQSITKMRIYTHTHTHTLPVGACTLHEVVSGYFFWEGEGGVDGRCTMSLLL
ncbi:hypothetical protein B0T12DRAFT_415725, partial [Alternaria alternata]